MKKSTYIISLLLLVYGSVLGQVGINTSNPQGIFDIDASADNGVAGTTPSAAQLSNDLIVTSTGQVGVMTTPSTDAKFEVNGRIKLTGGSPGTGKILVSDANGVASWKQNWTGIIYNMTAVSNGILIGGAAYSTTSSNVGFTSYTAPYTGFYRLTASYTACYVTGAGQADFQLRINNVVNGLLFDNTIASGDCIVSTNTRYLSLTAGDLLQWPRPAGTTGSSVSNASLELTFIK